VDQTLKLEYYHIGKKGEEKIEIHTFYKGGEWNGTRNQLLEPVRYGDMLIEVFDSISNTLIFSRSYSCLFGEYVATEKADTLEGKFEEVVLIPFPKNTILYKFTSFNRKQVPTIIYTGSFNPKETKTLSYTKEYKVKKLHKGGDPKTCLDILFIPDGYSENDKQQMAYDMKKFSSYIMECSPFSEHLDQININGIEAYSYESGITDPNADVYKNTVLNCSYNSLDLDRYLMCLNVFKMHNIAEDAPYDIIIIICNSPKYGGGGIYNFYCTVNNKGEYSDYVIVHELGHLLAGLGDEYYTSDVSVSNSPKYGGGGIYNFYCTVNNKGEYSDYVIVHELGHLLAGLGDEYYTSDVSVRDFYPEGIEPIEPNLTTLVAFEKKWKQQMDPETPIPTLDTKQYNKVLGVYQGGGYVAEGVYRPWQNCTMKEKLYNNFCPVCTKTILETIQYYSK
jgi:hypothetical protein